MTSLYKLNDSNWDNIIINVHHLLFIDVSSNTIIMRDWVSIDIEEKSFNEFYKKLLII